VADFMISKHRLGSANNKCQQIPEQFGHKIMLYFTVSCSL